MSDFSTRRWKVLLDGTGLYPIPAEDHVCVTVDMGRAIRAAADTSRAVEAAGRLHTYEPHIAGVLTELLRDPEVQALALRKLPEIGERMAERVRAEVRRRAEEMVASVAPGPVRA